MRSNTEILRTRKDSLARLLATEDLIIEHKKVPTAYFEPDTRKLVCPIPVSYTHLRAHET